MRVLVEIFNNCNFILIAIFETLYNILIDFLPFNLLIVLLISIVSILAFFRVIGD